MRRIIEESTKSNNSAKIVENPVMPNLLPGKSAEEAAGPANYQVSGKYHPVYVNSWDAWMKCLSITEKVPTKNGHDIYLIGPHIPWNIMDPKKSVVVFMLHYTTL